MRLSLAEVYSKDFGEIPPGIQSPSLLLFFIKFVDHCRALLSASGDQPNNDKVFTTDSQLTQPDNSYIALGDNLDNKTLAKSSIIACSQYGKNCPPPPILALFFALVSD